MTEQIIKKLLVFASLALVVSCDMSGDSAGKPESTGTNFSLVNSQTGLSSRIDIVYEKEISGDVSYIVSASELIIGTAEQFDASVETKKTKTVTSDDLVFDDYIAITSLSAATKYHVYIKYNGGVEALSKTTCPNSTAGKTAITGTITGSQGTYNYTITFPAGYGSTSEKWPFLVAMKAPLFSDPDFPCVVFTIDVYSGSTTDNNEIDNIKSTIKSFIENPDNDIDLNRIYLCGYSAGGNAAILIANDDTSDLYDVKALILEGARNWVSNYCANLGNTHAWIFYGETDTEDDQPGERIINMLPEGSGEHIETIMPGVGHTIGPVIDSPKVIMWLLGKQ